MPFTLRRRHLPTGPIPRLLRLLPRSLRGQFRLALSVLSLLILAGGLAAVYALRSASEATEQLAQERLVRMQQAQEAVQRALLIEREAERLLTTRSLPMVQQSYAAIVEQTAVLDRVVAGLANANDDAAVLDLYQASQLFRNTANIVAQLRESALQTEQAFGRLLEDRLDGGLQAAWRQGGHAALPALLLYRLQEAESVATVERLRADTRRTGSRRATATGERDPFAMRLELINERDVLHRFHGQLTRQAQSLVAVARVQSDHYDGDYRKAIGQLVAASRRDQQRVLVLLASSLLFAWLVAGVFFGRHVLRRLHQLSLHLQQHNPSGTSLDGLMRRSDEIGDMARAVDCFLADQRRLELQTAELGLTREHAVEQGRVLELIATGAPLADILERLVRLIESQLQGIQGSILLLDDAGQHLRHGAGPNLPTAYMQAIDGVRIGPTVGSCGTAAHRREPVIVADIQTDPLWADYRALAELHGLRSCWSAPILSHHGKVLGTFAMYSPQARVPTAADMRLIELATRIAGIAIEHRRAEQRISHMAHHDELTGLPNRALLNDRMAQALAQARRSGRPMALLYLDLDGFKFVNDSFGHAVGDALLIAVAGRLTAAVRQGDTVARLGGDEFAVMLQGLERAEDAVTITQAILEAMPLPLIIEGRSLRISASIGISVYPGDGSSGDTLLEHADVAMYRAKQQGRNGYQCYTDEMGVQARERVELHTALRQALEAQEFELHYQPQVDLRTGRINGMEALIRWHHPELGMVSPARFIPLAEETGLIVAIGEWVLRTACRQLRAWHAAGHAGLVAAVNLSARQFQGQDVAQMVRGVLDDCGLAGEFLELELTESALMRDAEAVLQTLNELKTMGIVLALDDFGTGYSSLSHLRRFPIDVIKIDQSFTFDVTHSAEAALITRAIIAMAVSLGMKTVAEGVETEAQWRFMSAHHCDSVQGYWFSRPLTVEAMSELLAREPQFLSPRLAEPASARTLPHRREPRPMLR